MLGAGPPWLWRGAVLGGVGERERAPVDEAIQPEQGQGHGDGAPQPSPLPTEHRHVGHYAQHRLRASGCTRDRADREGFKNEIFQSIRFPAPIPLLSCT